MKYQITRKVKPPQYSSDGAAGIDFFIPQDLGWEVMSIGPGRTVKLPSGIKLELRPTTCLVFLNKSSFGVKGLICSAPLVDEDYRGEVHLVVTNASNKDVVITAGQKLVQGVILGYCKEQLHESIIESETTRGDKGFGSTGTGLEQH